MFAKKMFHPFVRLNIQYFADGGNSGVDSDDTDHDEEPNLAEMMKNNPNLKQQYQEMLKTQLGKRMKKFEDVDVEEYRLLKEKAEKSKGKGKGSDKDDPDDDKDDLKLELKVKEEKLLRAQRREKRASVKEFAIDNGVDPKLLARLINVDDIELDEDGEPENLDELFKELQEEFPQYLKAQEQSGEEEEKETKAKTAKSNYYSPGSPQKMNGKPKEKNKREIGSSAYRRLKGIKE